MICHRPANLPFPLNHTDHYWWKTDTYESGMGETNKPGQIPAQGNSGLPFTPVSTVDHTGQSLASNAVCKQADDDIDEECVNENIKPGQDLGYFLPPANDCMTLIIKVGYKCKKKK